MTRYLTAAILLAMTAGSADAKPHKSRDIHYDAEISDPYLFQNLNCKIVIHGHGGGYETHNCKIVWKDK